MSAIGVSPCPPFSNRAGLPPGVLWDGNTAAWYKYNDAKTVFQDGANRVHAWLDRMNYAVGANVLPNPLNFTNVSWVPLAGAIVIDDNSFSSAGTSRLQNALYPLIVNTTYHLRARINLTLGVQLTIRDFNNVNTYYTYTGTGAFQNIDVCFTCAIVAGVGITLRLGAIGVVDFDYLIIEPIAGNHLLQYTAANQPIWSAANGILFDGAGDGMQTLPFVFNQPALNYMVGRQVTWFLNRIFIDGNALGSNYGYQSVASPNFTISGGIVIGNNANWVINTFSILRILFNGVNSFTQVNLTAAVNGNAGANNPGGFSLGFRGGGGGATCNIQVKEIILRRSADNAATQTSIYNYLKSSNAVP